MRGKVQKSKKLSPAAVNHYTLVIAAMDKALEMPDEEGFSKGHEALIAYLHTLGAHELADKYGRLQTGW